MNIGNLIIDGNLLLSPLAGISNYPFRVLARKYGASICYTEMVSADAIVRKQEKTIRMLDMPEDEHPVGVQLFGSSPEIMARAVGKINEFKPDIIDLNFGCPVRKVVKKNGGAALLKNIPLAGEIIAAAVENSSIPVTIKMRTGWDKNHEVFLELAKIAEKAGVAAVTLHPRSRSENYRKNSDWLKIAALKKEINIPVIGNGDIKTPLDAEKMFNQTGCDAIMIGRAAMKSPYIFRQIKVYLEDNILLPELSIPEKIDMALEHTRMMIDHYGEQSGTMMMRKHLSWYSSGFRAGAELRQKLMSISNYKAVYSLFEDYLNTLNLALL